MPSKENQEQLRNTFCTTCMKHFEDGTMKITADENFPLTQISAMHKNMDSNQRASKLIYTIEDLPVERSQVCGTLESTKRISIEMTKSSPWAMNSISVWIQE